MDDVFEPPFDKSKFKAVNLILPLVFSTNGAQSVSIVLTDIDTQSVKNGKGLYIGYLVRWNTPPSWAHDPDNGNKILEAVETWRNKLDTFFETLQLQQEGKSNLRTIEPMEKVEFSQLGLNTSPDKFFIQMHPQMPKVFEGIPTGYTTHPKRIEEVTLHNFWRFLKARGKLNFYPYLRTLQADQLQKQKHILDLLKKS